MKADRRHDFNNLLVKLRALVELIGQGGEGDVIGRRSLEEEGDLLIGEIARAWEKIKEGCRAGRS